MPDVYTKAEVEQRIKEETAVLRDLVARLSREVSDLRLDMQGR